MSKKRPLSPSPTESPTELPTTFSTTFDPFNESPTSSTYFIHPIYEKFFKKMLECHKLMHTQVESTQDRVGLGMVFTGTPRIGKSVFLFYVADRLKKEGVSFVITHGHKSFNSIYECHSLKSLQPTLMNSSSFHLIDPSGATGQILFEHPAFAVFFCSPTISNYVPYHKKNLLTLYMPLWSKEEMESCCTKLHMSFDEHRFTKWGGVFMDEFREHRLEKQLDEVLQSRMIYTLLTALDENSFSKEIKSNQWLLHRHPTENFESYTLSLPSTYIQEKVVQALETKKFDMTVTISNMNRLLIGCLYEKYVFKKLLIEKACLHVEHFDKRRQESALTLTIHNIKTYCNTDEFEQKDLECNTLYRPLENNKKGLDAVLICSDVAWIIQITISPKHKAIDIASVYRQFPSLTTWYILVIHPDPMSKNFHYPVINHPVGTEFKLTNRFVLQCKGFLTIIED